PGYIARAHGSGIRRIPHPEERRDTRRRVDRCTEPGRADSTRPRPRIYRFAAENRRPGENLAAPHPPGTRLFAFRSHWRLLPWPAAVPRLKPPIASSAKACSAGRLRLPRSRAGRWETAASSTDRNVRPNRESGEELP